MDYLDNGYTLIGAFLVGEDVKLQFAIPNGDSMKVITHRYTPDHPDFAWALQKLQEIQNV